MIDLAGCRDFLITNQNADGGWGFHPDSPCAVEPTAWAVLALVSRPFGPLQVEACARASNWLLRAQRSDGSWPPFPGHPLGCWVTSVASGALLLQGGAESAVERGLRWVVNSWPAEGTLWWRLRQAVFPSRLARQDSALRGWNWTPGTASWVEPTAQTLIFIGTLPPTLLSAQAVKRRNLGEHMLLDRMCPDGGWNSGNPLIYGVAGVPRIGPTAWALLALRAHSHRPEIQASLAWLERAYGTIRGGASLAVAHRCLAAFGLRVPPLAPALEKLYAPNSFFQNVLTMAWVTLALSEEAARLAQCEGSASA